MGEESLIGGDSREKWEKRNQRAQEHMQYFLSFTVVRVHKWTGA